MELPAEFTTMSEEETRDLARSLGEELVPGDIVAIRGPLGAGKTVFVRGLAQGVGADPEEVCSPTFALIHEYGAGQGRALIHLDLFRLSDEERELREIGLPDILAGKIAAVEWPGPMTEQILPVSHRVSLEPVSPEARRIRVERYR